jgi:hypothetical protein
MKTYGTKEYYEEQLQFAETILRYTAKGFALRVNTITDPDVDDLCLDIAALCTAMESYERALERVEDKDAE